jgi:hypothetical protein
MDAWKLLFPPLRHIHDESGQCLTYGDACATALLRKSKS